MAIRIDTKSQVCHGCRHPSGKPREHGLILCDACSYEVEEGPNGIMLYTKSAGARKRFYRYVPRSAEAAPKGI